MRNHTKLLSTLLIIIHVLLIVSCNKKNDAPNNKVPDECQALVTATDRYWQIFNEVLAEPKLGLDFSNEVQQIKVPSDMLVARTELLYLVEDEYGCWFANDYYHCSDLERNRREFIEEMDYYWRISLSYNSELKDCAPYLESLYIENQGQ